MRLFSLIQTLLLLLFFALGFSLSTCAPFPKEGEYKEEFQLTLQLQTRSSNRLGRTNSISKRKSEFVVLAPATAAFSNTAPSFAYSIDVDLATNTTKSLTVSENTYISRKLGFAFSDGFLIGILNPKIAAFFSSLFSQFVVPSQPLSTTIVMATTVSLIDIAAYCLAALVANTILVKHLFLNYARVRDCIFGLLLLLLALSVIYNSFL